MIITLVITYIVITRNNLLSWPAISRQPYYKIIICLANARRPGGRCIAGKETSLARIGNWIRPISPRPTAELSAEERRYAGGDDPEIFDILSIPLIAPAPLRHQTENHIIASGSAWERLSRFAWRNLGTLADSPPTLWGAQDSSTYGKHDRLPIRTASQFQNSLYLIRPANVRVRVLTTTDGCNFKRKRVRVGFEYGHVRYDFSVTDPVAQDSFLTRPDGEYTIGASYFCVSLSEAYTDGNCYKLVATIIPEA